MSLFINRSITKKFPTERFLKIVDNCVRNPGEVEYDKQNWLERQKNPSLAEKFEVKIGSPSMSLFINLSITKKFPTKRFLRTVDSSVRNPGEVEYDKQNRLQRQKPKLGRKI